MIRAGESEQPSAFTVYHPSVRKTDWGNDLRSLITVKISEEMTKLAECFQIVSVTLSAFFFFYV